MSTSGKQRKEKSTRIRAWTLIRSSHRTLGALPSASSSHRARFFFTSVENDDQRNIICASTCRSCDIFPLAVFLANPTTAGDSLIGWGLSGPGSQVHREPLAPSASAGLATGQTQVSERDGAPLDQKGTGDRGQTNRDEWTGQRVCWTNRAHGENCTVMHTKEQTGIWGAWPCDSPMLFHVLAAEDPGPLNPTNVLPFPGLCVFSDEPPVTKLAHHFLQQLIHVLSSCPG